MSLALGIMYLSARSRQPVDELKIAETTYNSKQAPDEQLPTEEIRRVQRMYSATKGTAYNKSACYSERLAKADRRRLEDNFATMVARNNAAELALGGGARDIEGYDVLTTAA